MDYNEFDGLPLAERLKHKLRMFRAIETEWKATAQLLATYPKGYRRLKVKDLMKDVKKGLKVINKKNKMYVEMPELVSVGNGQVKKVYDSTLPNSTADDEIDVQLPSCDNNLPLIE